MSQSPAYNLWPQVERVRTLERIGEEELCAMVEQSALTTHERGNRRFHHWLFHVVGNDVRSMTHFEPATKTVYEPGLEKAHSLIATHADCDGEGCGLCGYTGEVLITYKPRTRNRPVLRLKKS